MIQTVNRNLVQVRGLSKKLDNPSVEDVRNFVHKVYSGVEYIPVEKGLEFGTDGRINGEYRFTANGLDSFLRYYGLNAGTIKQLWNADPEHCAQVLNTLMKEAEKTEKAQLVTNRGVIEGMVSKSYGVIETPEVFDEFIKTNPNIDFVFAKFNGLNSRFVALPENPVVIEPKPGDSVKLGIDWHNGMAGRAAFDFNLMLLRMACSNGCVLGDIAAGTKVRHIGGNAAERAIEGIAMQNAPVDEIQHGLKRATENHLGENRMGFLTRKLRDYTTKRFSTSVVEEYDHPSLPDHYAGETQYDYWNAVTHKAKEAGDDQRGIERAAWKLVTAALPKETEFNRVRVDPPLTQQMEEN